MVNLSLGCKFWPIFCCGSSISSVFKRMKRKQVSVKRRNDEPIGNFRNEKSNYPSTQKKKFTGYTPEQNGDERRYSHWAWSYINRNYSMWIIEI